MGRLLKREASLDRDLWARCSQPTAPMTCCPSIFRGAHTARAPVRARARAQSRVILPARFAERAEHLAETPLRADARDEGWRSHLSCRDWQEPSAARGLGIIQAVFLSDGAMAEDIWTLQVVDVVTSTRPVGIVMTEVTKIHASFEIKGSLGEASEIARKQMIG
jgi:hypothetical protein